MLQLLHSFNIHRPDNTNVGRSWLKLHFKKIQRFGYRRAHLNQSATAVSYSDATLFLCDWGIFTISFPITPSLRGFECFLFFFFSLMVSLQAKPDMSPCIHVHKPHHAGRGVCALLPPKRRVVFHDLLQGVQEMDNCWVNIN